MIKEWIARFALWLIEPKQTIDTTPRYVREMRQRRKAKTDRQLESANAVSMGRGRPMMDAAIAEHRERRKKWLEAHPDYIDPQPRNTSETKVELKPGELFPGVRAR